MVQCFPAHVRERECTGAAAVYIEEPKIHTVLFFTFSNTKIHPGDVSKSVVGKDVPYSLLQMQFPIVRISHDLPNQPLLLRASVPIF